MAETKTPDASVVAVIVAAGRGERMGGAPKQYRLLAGEPVLARAIAALARAPSIDRVLCVIGAEHRADYDGAVSCLPPAIQAKLLPPCPGGSSRQLSALAGLTALAESEDAPAIVLVHDAARPLVSPALIEAAIAAARVHGAAIPGLPVTDTLKLVDEAGRIEGTPERARLRAVQTPQAFDFAALLGAHRRARAAGVTSLTDDAAVMEWAGARVHVFPGEAGNMKLTTQADFAAAEQRLAGPLTTRVGFGYDIHAFGPGDGVTLCGVRLPHDAERGPYASVWRRQNPPKPVGRIPDRRAWGLP